MPLTLWHPLLLYAIYLLTKLSLDSLPSCPFGCLHPCGGLLILSVVSCLRQALRVHPRIAWNSQTSVSLSWVLRLPVCATIPGWGSSFCVCFYFYFIIMMQICRSGSYPHVCGQYIILTAKWFACHCVRNVHKSSSPLPVSNYTGSYQPVLTSPSISQCTVNDCPGSRSVCSCGFLKRLPAFGVARSKFNLWFGADP